MKNRFVWQHIEFSNGSNPYICKTEAEFKRLQSKYNLKQLKCGFWMAKEKVNNDLKRQIVTWLLNNENRAYRVNECIEEFRPCIYTTCGEYYLMGGKEVEEFILNADKLLFTC